MFGSRIATVSNPDVIIEVRITVGLGAEESFPDADVFL
jgi:hypothetical protein